MKDRSRIILLIYTALAIFTFYLPIILVAILSFNSGASISLPMSGFSTYWYVGEPGLVGTSGFTSGIIHDPGIVEAVSNSLILGVVTAGVTTPLVVSSALAFRYRFRGRDIIFYLLLSGFVIPAVILGLGTNFFYKAVGVKVYSIWTVVPVHVVYAIPFGLVLMMARFDPMMVEYENVARTLGASAWRVFRKIVFPLIRVQVISVVLFAFTLSFSELLRAQFVIGGTGTISTYVLNQMSVVAPTPKWFALGTLTTAVSLTVLLLLAIMLTRGQRRII